jgi:hypothetical protein
MLLALVLLLSISFGTVLASTLNPTEYVRFSEQNKDESGTTKLSWANTKLIQIGGDLFKVRKVTVRVQIQKHDSSWGTMNGPVDLSTQSLYTFTDEVTKVVSNSIDNRKSYHYGNVNDGTRNMGVSTYLRDSSESQKIVNPNY